MTEEKFMRDLR